jgi:hypothetical protein
MGGGDLSPDEGEGTEEGAVDRAAGEVERTVGERDMVIGVDRSDLSDDYVTVNFRSSMSSQDVVVAQEQ